MQAGVTAGSTAVALDDATVAFRLAGNRVYTAVQQARLTVEHGEFVAIVGPTGCGKSTLLNIAAGLLKPVSGSVRIFDTPLSGLNKDAGYLFQADALFPWKTAIDNVAIGLETSGTPRAEALERAQSWLAQVGLGAFGNRYPHMLSGGQRKRIGLAQVLIRDPKILLMDEPFGPLDAQTRQIMGNLLLQLWNADRKAVLFVTHDLEEAIALADRVVIMSAGPSAAGSRVSGGGNDGVRTGTYGFHTQFQEHPWWVVDLLEPYSIAEIHIYNRTGPAAIAARASALDVLLSIDGDTWSVPLSRTDPEPFGLDGSPLVILGSPDTRARFVLLRLRGSNFLHLLEVEVYGRPV